MTLTLTVLTASLVCYLLKLAGYLAPHRWLTHERGRRIVGLVTVALLAALVAVQTALGPGRSLVVDARVAGLAVAVVALALRAPFVVVVVLAAVTAAGLRAGGIG